MSTVEQELTYLEREAQALKASFEQQASQIPVFTNEAEIATTPNLCHYVYPVPEAGQQADYEVYEYERIMVTYDTTSGIDTIATIEVDSDRDVPPKIRRINHAGGARWIISNSANLENGSDWKATNYKIVIHAIADGVIMAENITT